MVEGSACPAADCTSSKLAPLSGAVVKNVARIECAEYPRSSPTYQESKVLSSLTEQELPAYDLPDKASRGIRKMRHHSEQAPVEQAVRLLAVTR